MNKTISRVLRTQGHNLLYRQTTVIYQQNIEENRMFQTQKYHKFRLARNIAFALVSGFPVG